jgi:hypothetical protein
MNISVHYWFGKSIDGRHIISIVVTEGFYSRHISKVFLFTCREIILNHSHISKSLNDFYIFLYKTIFEIKLLCLNNININVTIQIQSWIRKINRWMKEIIQDYHHLKLKACAIIIYLTITNWRYWKYLI